MATGRSALQRVDSTATFRYKRGFRHECICHDDVYRWVRSKNDAMKLLGRVKVGQPATVKRRAL